MIQQLKKWQTPIYFLVYLLLVLFLFREFIFDGEMALTSRYSDRVAAMGIKEPIRTALTENGNYALWNPAILGGMPTVDATSGDIMYPLSLPLYFLFPIFRLDGFTMILHVLIAGIAFFCMLRKSFHTPRVVAFAGGLLYMLNPQFFSHLLPGHDGKMFVIALLPLMVWALRALLAKPDLLRSTLLAAVVGVGILSSHVQMSYFVLWGLFAYWVQHTIRLWMKERSVKALLPTAGAFWGAMLLILAFSAVLLFPAFSYVQDAWSVRGVERDLDYVATWSLHWPEFFSLWIPQFSGWIQSYWSENPLKLNTEYAGLMASLLGLLALISRPKDPWRLFWTGTAVFAVLISLGTHTPVLSAAYHLIPGVAKFRAISMIMFWFSFAAVLLASLFLRDLLEGYYEQLSDFMHKRAERTLLILMGAATLLLLIFLNRDFIFSIMSGLTEGLADSEQKKQIFFGNYSDNFIPALYKWWILTLATLGLCFGYLKRSIPKEALFALFLAIAMIDLIPLNTEFITINDHEKYAPESPRLDKLARGMDQAPFRVFFLPGVSNTRNIAGVYGLEGVGGFHDNELKWYRAFRREGNTHYVMPHLNEQRTNFDVPSLKTGSTFLNIANCRYMIARMGNDFYPIENTNALPRIAFTTQYTLADSAGTIGKLQAPGFDWKREAVLRRKPAFESTPVREDEIDVTDAWETYSVNYRKARITAPRKGLLRIAEVYYPGWKIFVDGEEAEVLRSNHAWMAVEVSEGEHVIEMKADSLYLSRVLPLSVITWIAFVLFWAITGVRKALKRKNK
ncbi:MAG: hypothetical protein ACQEQV_07260 [Fibrobacterota bacterium]